MSALRGSARLSSLRVEAAFQSPVIVPGVRLPPGSSLNHAVLNGVPGPQLLGLAGEGAPISDSRCSLGLPSS
jgi:hypothetical protein